MAILNHKLQNLYDFSNIIGINKSYRIKWFGHMLRMQDDRMVQKVYKKISVEKHYLAGPEPNGQKVLHVTYKDYKLDLPGKSWSSTEESGGKFLNKPK